MRTLSRTLRTASGLALLALAGASAFAADKTGKPPPSNAFAPKPDLKVWIDPDGTVAVQNVGDASAIGNIVVKITCEVRQATVPGQKCAQPFAAGAYGKTLPLPAGYKQAPVKLQPPISHPNNEKIGPGWFMVYPSTAWTSGKYQLIATVDAGVQDKDRTNNGASATVMTP